MDKLLAAIATSLPAMLQTHGPTLLWAITASVGCVFLWLDNRRLNKTVADEIKEGIRTARGFEATFNAAIEALRQRRIR